MEDGIMTLSQRIERVHAALGWQAANVRVILAAHEASRKLVEEACDKLLPLLAAMRGDNPHVTQTVKEAHAMLKAALEGER